MHLQEKGLKKPGTDRVSASGYVMVSILFNDPDKREFVRQIADAFSSICSKILLREQKTAAGLSEHE